MQNPRLAARYAKSLLDLSLEQNSLDTTYADMSVISSICHTNSDFVSILKSPVIKLDKKQAIVSAVTQQRIAGLSQQFINLLISKGREGVLPEIANSFIAQYKEYKQVKVVKLNSASEVPQATIAAIKEKLAQALPGKKIEIEANVKPELIGGFVLEIGDQQIDASVAFDLKEISKQFLNNDYLYKIK
jgi:F-type H+-transporting ATPase subunit delta